MADVTQGWKEKIMNLMGKVPGYSGYAQREGMRDEDKVVRSFIANDLNRVKGRLLDLGVPLAEKEPENPKEFEQLIDTLYDIDETSQELDRVIDLIRFATYGYSGLFDAKEVNEPELQKLQEFDKSLAGYSSILEESLIPIQEAIRKKEPIAEQLDKTKQVIAELDRKFFDREKIIKGVA